VRESIVDLKNLGHRYGILAACIAYMHLLQGVTINRSGPHRARNYRLFRFDAN